MHVAYDYQQCACYSRFSIMGCQLYITTLFNLVYEKTSKRNSGNVCYLDKDKIAMQKQCIAEGLKEDLAECEYNAKSSSAIAANRLLKYVSKIFKH